MFVSRPPYICFMFVTACIQRDDGNDFSAWIDSVKADPAVIAFVASPISELFKHPDIVRMYRCKTQDGSEVDCNGKNSSAHDDYISPLLHLNNRPNKVFTPDRFVYLKDGTQARAITRAKEWDGEFPPPPIFSNAQLDGNDTRVSKQLATLLNNTNTLDQKAESEEEVKDREAEIKHKKVSEEMLKSHRNRNKAFKKSWNLMKSIAIDTANNDTTAVAKIKKKDVKDNVKKMMDIKTKQQTMRQLITDNGEPVPFRRNVQFRGSLRFENASEWGIPPGAMVRRTLLINYGKWFHNKAHHAELARASVQWHGIESRKSMMRMQQVNARYPFFLFASCKHCVSFVCSDVYVV